MLWGSKECRPSKLQLTAFCDTKEKGAPAMHVNLANWNMFLDLNRLCMSNRFQAMLEAKDCEVQNMVNPFVAAFGDQETDQEHGYPAISGYTRDSERNNGLKESRVKI